MSLLRTIAQRAFCELCMEVVSPHPRLHKSAAWEDLRAHKRDHHPRGRKSPISGPAS